MLVINTDDGNSILIRFQHLEKETGRRTNRGFLEVVETVPVTRCIIKQGPVGTPVKDMTMLVEADAVKHVHDAPNAIIGRKAAFTKALAVAFPEDRAMRVALWEEYSKVCRLTVRDRKNA